MLSPGANLATECQRCSEQFYATSVPFATRRGCRAAGAPFVALGAVVPLAALVHFGAMRQAFEARQAIDAIGASGVATASASCAVASAAVRIGRGTYAEFCLVFSDAVENIVL